MKKFLLFLSVLALLLSSACTQSSSGPHVDTNQSLTVSDVLSAAASASPAAQNAEPRVTLEAPIGTDSSPRTEAPTAPQKGAASNGLLIDIDLTAMSASMVYAQVYDMLTHPEEYLGKTVKMAGQFAVYQGDTRNYYACVIADATACCAQGIEFLPASALTYPDEFPSLDTYITVIGTFDTYREENYEFCQLIDAILL